MKNRMIVAATLMVLVVCVPAGEQVAAAGVQATQKVQSLDDLLAPVALYPDQLLAQILMCAQDPAQVVKLDQWIKSTKGATGTQLQDAALKAGFDASFVALAIFPDVVARMAAQKDWTTLLGQAFTADRSVVFKSIQRLRHQAQD